MNTKLTTAERLHLLRTKNCLSMSGISIEKHKNDGICIICEESAVLNSYSPAGLKEFHISGFCELCFDTLFADNAEDKEL